MASHLLRTSLRVLAQPTFRPLARRVPTVAFTAVRPFTAGMVRMNQGTVDSDLAHKLGEELEFEHSSAPGEQPAFIKEFLESNAFQIEDKPGNDEVALTRNFGNEKIRVLFSISDINNAPENDFLPETEEEDLTEGNAEEEEEDVISASFPVRASVTIEKEGQGAITVDTVAQDGEVSIESVIFYKDAKLAREQSAEADWQRRGQYIGPQFDELDEGLQSLFGRYLEERGINTALATFLPDYVDYKEQKEYVQWLKGVKNFVSA
ncbi:Mitochondrial acidic protein mam33 [Apophysomyces sp. BC1034]|nr:Mitochondrial acidic protein mam33 [Apophysomyces sp. BC1015]KAG0183264.1 Mitochondrial acidic protein mam33 [Apophysomyces sp. BC1021]KAG0194045.1 Mitochondrial acidic protein mam33 [Apophysomyces sp. BC1034]